MKILSTLILSITLLLAACSPPPVSFKSSDITGVDWGRSLSLTDHNGQARQLADFKGKVVVLFFGYTQCPDVCPTTLLAMREAEAYPGPSLILAYSHCIAHGIPMEAGMHQQKLAVESAYWPLIRYNPELRRAMHNPFVLDSPGPRKELEDYVYNEMRYKILTKTNPPEAERLMALAKEMVRLRWDTYKQMADTPASGFSPVH